MVKKLIGFIGREISGLHQAAYLLGAFALGSQVLALVRDRILAYTFGAGSDLDLYYAAFRIPDFIFATIASVVSASALIPFLARELEKSEREARTFFNAVFSVFLIAVVCASVVMFFLIPRLSRFLFPAFSPSDTATLVMLSRVLLISPILLGVSNLFGAVTQIYNRYFLFAISPVLYNVGIICGALFLLPVFGLKGLVYGVVLGAFLHMLIQVPFILKKGFFPKLIFRGDIRRVKEVLLVAFPRTLALSSNEIVKFFLISIASVSAVGSISVFTFAHNLQSVPLSIIGVSYSLAAFPTLSRFISAGEIKKYLEHLMTSARHIIFLSMPILALFIVLRAHIVRLVLGSGEFSWSDTRLTAAALALFVVSLLPQGLSLLFIRARYAAGNTKLPVAVTLTSSICIVLFAYMFTKLFVIVPSVQFFFENLFKVEGIYGTSILMLPFAFSLGLWIQVVLLWVSFGREFRGFTLPLLRTGFESLGAATIIGFVSYQVLYAANVYLVTNTYIGLFTQAAVSGFIGIAAGIVVLRLLRSKELAELWKALHSRFWKSQPIFEETEVL